MATAPSFRATAETSPPSATGRSAGYLTAAPSPEEKGFFYSNYVLPGYDSTVDESAIAPIGKPKELGTGTAYLESWPMEDEASTCYKVMRCLADAPADSGLWVVKDTAWSMQPEGVNEDIAEKLMGLGFNVMVKGPEIGSSVPQSQSAFNTHTILDVMSQRGDLDASRILVEGYSRGSMIGFGTNAYAQTFDRKVLYSNLTDPCVAVGIGLNNETAEKAVTLPMDLALLGIAVAKGLINPKRTGAFLRTVDLSYEGAKQFVRTGKPLMNGEAGQLAARTPLDMQATIAFFRHSRTNDENIFRQILADRPGVRFVTPEGGHGGALDLRIIGNIAVRFGRISEQLAEGRSPEELDYRYITYGLKSAD